MNLASELAWALEVTSGSELAWALEGGRVSDLGWALEQRGASETSRQGWGLGSGLGLRSAPGQTSHRPPWPLRWRPTPPPQTRRGRQTRPRRSLNGVQTPERSPSSWTSPPWWTLPEWERKWVRVPLDPQHPLEAPASSHGLASPQGPPGLPWPLTQLWVPDAHVTLQQVIHPPRRLLLKFTGLEA